MEHNQLLCFSQYDNVIYKHDTVTQCNWLNTHLSKAAFKIVPNPSHGNCYFITESIFRESEIYIRDFAGRIILRAKLSNQEQNIDLTGLPKGFYIVELRNGNRYATRKLILQ